jgi:hypothetical protein
VDTLLELALEVLAGVSAALFEFETLNLGTPAAVRFTACV